MPVPTPDYLGEFASFLTKLEYVLLKLTLLIVFVLWLWDKLKHEFKRAKGPHFPP